MFEFTESNSIYCARKNSKKIEETHWVIGAKIRAYLKEHNRDISANIKT